MNCYYVLIAGPLFLHETWTVHQILQLNSFRGFVLHRLITNFAIFSSRLPEAETPHVGTFLLLNFMIFFWPKNILPN